MPMVCRDGDAGNGPTDYRTRAERPDSRRRLQTVRSGLRAGPRLAIGEGCARVAARFAGAGRGDFASDRLPLNYNVGGAAMARAARGLHVRAHKSVKYIAGGIDMCAHTGLE